MSCQDPALGERGRLERFVGDTYAPLLTKKAVKATTIAFFGIIFVSCRYSHSIWDQTYLAVHFLCFAVFTGRISSMLTAHLQEP